MAPSNNTNSSRSGSSNKAQASSRNKGRSNTPRNNNKSSKSKTPTPTPRTKGRSQTPSHKHKYHATQTQTPNQTPTPKQKRRGDTPSTSTRAATPFASPSQSQSQQQQQQQQQQSQQQNLSPETLLAFNEALEDVHTRFILNLPEEELSSSDRLFFQMEQAWWFYEDFICDEMDDIKTNNGNNNNNDTTTTTYASVASNTNTNTNTKIDYPRFTNLKPFAKKLFEISPILSPLLPQFESLYRDFSKYKRKISTYGTILLNADCTKFLLCQDYNGKAWTLPAGKVNQNEKGVDAAVRETYEETGFDICCNFGGTRDIALENAANGNGNAGGDDNGGNGGNEIGREGDTPISPLSTSSTPSSPLTDHVPWTTNLTDDHALVYIENDGSGKRRTCYICHGVPENFPFAPVVRKEVADVQWHSIDDIPKKTFAVLPFMRGLRKWIRKNITTNTNTNTKKNDRKKDGSAKKGKGQASSSTPKKGRSGSKHKNRPTQSSSSTASAGTNDDDLVQSGLIQAGEDNRWSEDDMFRTNEELIGRKIEYDGNPQHFATNGFDGNDPHAFRIVGGELMNSGGRDIAKAPDKSQLQPLYRPDVGGGSDEESGFGNVSGGDDEDDLKPFFGDDGATPWGEKVFGSEPKDKAKNKEGGSRVTQKKRADENISSTPRSARSTGSVATSSSRSECSSDMTHVSESSIPSASDFEDSLFSGKGIVDHDSQGEKKTESNESSGLAILNMLRGGEKKDKNKDRVIPAMPSSKSLADNDALDVFMTDREITAKSQKQKNQHNSNERKRSQNADEGKEAMKENQRRSGPGNEHLSFALDWVKSLPNPPPSKYFGEFKFDYDAIMVAVMKAP